MIKQRKSTYEVNGIGSGVTVEPKGQDVSRVHNFNATPNGGQKHDSSRAHIRGPQAKGNQYKVSES